MLFQFRPKYKFKSLWWGHLLQRASDWSATSKRFPIPITTGWKTKRRFSRGEYTNSTRENEICEGWWPEIARGWGRDFLWVVCWWSLLFAWCDRLRRLLPEKDLKRDFILALFDCIIGLIRIKWDSKHVCVGDSWESILKRKCH